MYRIFLIEHENLLSDMLRQKFTKLGCEVLSYFYADFSLEEMKLHVPGIVMLDFIKSFDEGNELCRAIKAEHEQTLVIAIIGHDFLQQVDCRSSFDEFALSTCDFAEIECRINLMAFKNNLSANLDIITFDQLEINVANYEVRVFGESVELTYKEFELLKFFLRNPGRVYSRDVLLNQIWGFEYYGGTRTVDVHIRRLRFKLGQAGNMIKTVRNVGYKIFSSY